MELDGYAEISARNAVEAIAAVEGAAVLARPLRAQHPRRRLGDGAQPRAPLRRRRQAARRDPGGDPGGRRDRPRPGRGDRGVVLRRAEPDARRRAARARPALRGRRGGAAGRRAADGQPVRDHGHARGVHARRGGGRARRRSARRSPTTSRRRRPASSSARARESKVAKAQKAGVPILTEADLRKLVKDAPPAKPTASRRPAPPLPASPPAASSRREAVLRAASPSSVEIGAAVLEDRERRSGRERSRRGRRPCASCPSSRSRARGPALARAGPRACRRRRPPRATGGRRSRSSPSARPASSSATTAAAVSRSSRERPEPSAEPNAGERHAGLAERVPHDTHSGGRRPAPE